MKKKFYYIIGAVAMLGIAGSITGCAEDTDTSSTVSSNASSNKETTATKAPKKKTAATKKPVVTKAPKATKKPKVKKVKKHRKGMYGISNKKAPDDLSVQKMNNDVTGNFRYCMTTDKKHIEDYALDYYKRYMKDGEVHYIINTTYNITACITNLGDRLDLLATSYVSKEEHDAKAIGGGELLGEFHIYLDNGDIEQIQ